MLKTLAEEFAIRSLGKAIIEKGGEQSLPFFGQNGRLFAELWQLQNSQEIPLQKSTFRVENYQETTSGIPLFGYKNVLIHWKSIK